ncbi:hypothetical protein B0T19DRAFT_216196 [Cercophora scortea]|uniref:Protein kinase domain-containing protein n=1 Tax=Cercophora scortea TaxID=314031 RepID=A0AAE0IF41_9PEZI|nr:hypothetical protein B0T19DRAFT_216196 [Cercophora scortea]
MLIVGMHLAEVEAKPTRHAADLDNPPTCITNLEAAERDPTQETHPGRGLKDPFPIGCESLSICMRLTPPFLSLPPLFTKSFHRFSLATLCHSLPMLVGFLPGFQIYSAITYARIMTKLTLTPFFQQTTVRTLPMVKPTRDLRTRLLAASSGMNDAEARELNHFVDLLERCLTLNPDKRLTPADALRHPFFTHRVHTSAR